MISCILLAAGLSQRFGSPKPLAMIQNQTVIEFLLSRLLETKISQIIVVLGAESEKIKPYILKNKRIKTITNKNYSLGQASSFKTGLTLLDQKTKGIMLMPVDMPFIRVETFDLLINTFLKKPLLILVPVYEGRPGHPPIFSIQLLEEFKDLKNEEPLYNIQHRHESEVIKVPVHDEGIISSFNTPYELENIVEKWQMANRK